jgi:hypothetical protein
MDTWSDAGHDEDDIPLKKVEEVIIVKKPTLKRNLIQMIETILASYELQEKYSTKLTQFCMVTIAELVKKHPEYFRMVESTLIRNIHNNKIKAEDVPYVISIVSQLHTLLLQIRFNTMKNSEPITDTCSNILKFLFSVSLRENMVKMDSETDIMLLLLCFDSIIDSCMKLLRPIHHFEVSEPNETIVPFSAASVPVVVSLPVPLPDHHKVDEIRSTIIPKSEAKKSSCCGCF